MQTVYVCSSGRSFSSKLSEIHEAIKAECTPIIACFDVGSESNKDHYFKAAKQPKFHPAAQSDSPLPSPTILRREITFSSESDESYGLQLLSRIASDLQVEEGAKVIIPVAIVQPKRKGSIDDTAEHSRVASITRSPYGNETAPATVEDRSDVIDPQMMLQCLDAGALDVVKSPLDKAGIMGLTVHAYRVYKKAKKEQAGFMALAKRGRKQSWVGVEEEQPYAYLREAMVKKLLKGICEPETVIEDYQHRGLHVDAKRRDIIATEVGSWGFCGHDFDEDELVYAGYCMLNHALQSAELEKWRMTEGK
jgi:3',5'-cyclic-nucleotide phosphodiesterase